MRIVASISALVIGCGSAIAEAPPCSQIKMIVPFPAGGATDVAGRIVAEPLGAVLKKIVVIENRSGATGNIGTAVAVKSPPDGCTLVVNVAAISTYPMVFKKLSFDPIKDLAPIAGIGRSPTLLLTSVTAKAKTIKELVVWSKEKSDGLTYATAGLGLLPHLAVEETARLTGANFVPVFYKGAPDFMSDLMAIRVGFGSTAAANSLALVRAGKLRALAVMQEKRAQLAPDIPSSAEQGFSPLDASAHFMLFAPAATPKSVIQTLSAEVIKIVGNPANKEKFNAVGFDPSPIGPDEASAAIRRTEAGWVDAIKAMKAKAK